MDKACVCFGLVFIACFLVGYGEDQERNSLSRQRRSSFRDQEHCARVDLRYRQLDGSCNHPDGHGRINRPVKRYLSPVYHDMYGVDGPRAYSVLGRRYPLPSPRRVSMVLHPDKPKPSEFTLLVMQLGQLIDHDMTLAPTPAESNMSIPCCDVARKQRSSECLPIMVPPSDPMFDRCMEFVRSTPALDVDGNKILPREQINALTSFLDASSIYGQTQGTLAKLRTQKGKGALLKTRRVYGKQRLPSDPHGDCLKTNHPLSYCQMAGDERVNEQPGLSSLHLVFHLTHNTIVRSLVKEILRRRDGVTPSLPIINGYISNAPTRIKETLFQETRKILSAILQKLTYCDWLPMVLGPRLIIKYDLGCDELSRYNPSVDPRVSNVFLAAAFRFGHSLVPNRLLVDYSARELKDMFQTPDPCLFHFESIMDGLCEKGMSQAFDRFVSKSVTTSLFRTSKKPFDLVSLNIQRGRDHGIPSYYYWRKRFGLKRFMRWEQFGNNRIAQDLKRTFDHPRDVDLFTGGLIERPVPGGIVGETFGNILGQQFSDIKVGDAYFFLSTEKPQGFNAAQREAILEVSAAQIICYSSKMGLIQKNPFLESSQTNPLVPCKNLPAFDVTPWLEMF